MTGLKLTSKSRICIYLLHVSVHITRYLCQLVCAVLAECFVYVSETTTKVKAVVNVGVKSSLFHLFVGFFHIDAQLNDYSPHGLFLIIDIRVSGDYCFYCCFLLLVW